MMLPSFPEQDVHTAREAETQLVVQVRVTASNCPSRVPRFAVGVHVEAWPNQVFLRHIDRGRSRGWGNASRQRHSQVTAAARTRVRMLRANISEEGLH